MNWNCNSNCNSLIFLERIGIGIGIEKLNFFDSTAIHTVFSMIVGQIALFILKYPSEIS